MVVHLYVMCVCVRVRIPMHACMQMHQHMRTGGSGHMSCKPHGRKQLSYGLIYLSSWALSASKTGQLLCAGAVHQHT